MSYERYSDLDKWDKAKCVKGDRFRIDKIVHKLQTPYEQRHLEEIWRESICVTEILATSISENWRIFGKQYLYARDTASLLRTSLDDLPKHLTKLEGDRLCWRTGPGPYLGDKKSYDFIIHKGKILDLPARIEVMGTGQKRPYINFSEEKEHRKNKRFGWGNIYSPDPGIKSILEMLNGSEFAYTLFQSCSCSPKDHHGEYQSYPFCSYTDKGGFIPLRLKTDDPKAINMLEALSNEGVKILEDVPKDVDRNEQQEDTAVKTGVIRPGVPKKILNPSHPEHLTYSSKRWAKVADLIRSSIR